MQSETAILAILSLLLGLALGFIISEIKNAGKALKMRKRAQFEARLMEYDRNNPINMAYSRTPIMADEEYEDDFGQIWYRIRN